MSPYQERFFFFQTFEHQVELQLSTWQISSDLSPPQYVPKSLNLKILFTWGNRWLGGICGSLRQEPKITWGGQELMWRSDFPRNRTGKRPLYFVDWKRSGGFSADIQFLWAPSPDLSVALRSLSTTLGGTRRHLSERSNPGEDKSLDLFH